MISSTIEEVPEKELDFPTHYSPNNEDSFSSSEESAIPAEEENKSNLSKLSIHIDNSPFRKKGKNCLFLGDLSAFCTEEILEQEFSPFGTIIHLRIARSKTQNKSLLFGFIEFEATNSALDALNGVNRKIICGRAIKIRWAEPDEDESTHQPKTFCLKLTELSPHVQDEYLHSIFASFGNLISLQLQHGNGKTGKKQTLPHAVVEYSEVQSAVTAMKEMDGKLLYGKSLQIQWAATPTPSKKQMKRDKAALKAEDTSKTVSVFVSFNGLQSDIVITDERIRNVFVGYGIIEDVAIRLTVQDKETNVQKGYAFVCFPNSSQGIEYALAAAHELQDMIIDNVRYQVEISRQLKVHLQQLEEEARQRKVLVEEQLALHQVEQHQLQQQLQLQGLGLSIGVASTSTEQDDVFPGHATGSNSGSNDVGVIGVARSSSSSCSSGSGSGSYGLHSIHHNHSNSIYPMVWSTDSMQGNSSLPPLPPISISIPPPINTTSNPTSNSTSSTTNKIPSPMNRTTNKYSPRHYLFPSSSPKASERPGYSSATSTVVLNHNNNKPPSPRIVTISQPQQQTMMMLPINTNISNVMPYQSSYIRNTTNNTNNTNNSNVNSNSNTANGNNSSMHHSHSHPLNAHTLHTHNMLLTTTTTTNNNNNHNNNNNPHYNNLLQQPQQPYMMHCNPPPHHTNHTNTNTPPKPSPSPPHNADQYYRTPLTHKYPLTSTTTTNTSSPATSNTTHSTFSSSQHSFLSSATRSNTNSPLDSPFPASQLYFPMNTIHNTPQNHPNSVYNHHNTPNTHHNYPSHDVNTSLSLSLPSPTPNTTILPSHHVNLMTSPSPYSSPSVVSASSASPSTPFNPTSSPFPPSPSLPMHNLYDGSSVMNSPYVKGYGMNTNINTNNNYNNYSYNHNDTNCSYNNNSYNDNHNNNYYNNYNNIQQQQQPSHNNNNHHNHHNNYNHNHHNNYNHHNNTSSNSNSNSSSYNNDNNNVSYHHFPNPNQQHNHHISNHHNQHIN